MIKQRIRFCVNRRSSRGFTLIEVLVAMFLGLIVMGMAVAVLGVTNSTSLRVLAKSEVQQNSRASIVKLLDSLANAESLQNCRVGDDLIAQNAIKSSPNRPAINPSDCLDTVSSGYVLAWAQPNRLCYFKKDGESAAKIHCITRGGTGADASYNSTGPVPAFAVPAKDGSTSPLAMNLVSCLPVNIGTDPRLVYSYECNATAGGASFIKWAGTYNLTPNTTRLIADLGSTLPNTPANSPRANLFAYTFEDGSKTSAGVVPSKLIQVVAVDVNMNVKYHTQRAGNLETFIFDQTIILRGSRKATQENYNG